MRFTPILLLALCKAAASSPQVQLGSTTVVGSDVTGTVPLEFFGGIPYAEPPTGQLRFALPVPKTSLGVATFDASQYGPSCFQFLTFNPPITGQLSEDCLSVNIVRPAGTTSNANLPVMVWIYGGEWIAGAANQFDSTDLVRRSVSRGTPVIYVSINYRLGPLGFPVGTEPATRGALNLGLKDCLAALNWVQQNIGAFGGDITKVTAFGESAGAFNIAMFMLNTGFTSMARGAILESGSVSLTPKLPAEGDPTWNAFVAAVPECANASPGDTFDCLRTASVDEIVTAGLANAGWAPVVDGPGGVLPDKPTNLWNAGNFANMPFISGNNKDEGTLFTDTTIHDVTGVTNAITSNFDISSRSPSDQQRIINRLLQLYPNIPALGSPYDTGNETFGFDPQWKRAASLVGDILFQASRRAQTRAAVHNNVPVYAYLFTERNPNLDAYLGVSHGSEIAYIYPETQLFNIPWTKSPSQLVLQQNMMDYWISFACTLNPNDNHGNANRPHWPQYGPLSADLQLDASNTHTIVDKYRAIRMDYIISQA